MVFVGLTAALLLTSARGPAAVVEAGNAQVHKLLQSGEATVESLASKADDFVDFVELARRALGADWAKLTKTQQDEFSRTMRGLLRASYAQRAIQEGRGQSSVVYGKEKLSRNEAEVETTLEVKGGSFPVLYRLFRRGGQWRIYDVVTDDVSLVATYRDQFRQLIAKRGYDGLLSTLRAKKEQLERTTSASAR
jgi:phospholipid transport system substrate-binding protein